MLEQGRLFVDQGVKLQRRLLRGSQYAGDAAIYVAALDGREKLPRLLRCVRACMPLGEDRRWRGCCRPPEWKSRDRFGERMPVAASADRAASAMADANFNSAWQRWAKRGDVSTRRRKKLGMPSCWIRSEPTSPRLRWRRCGYRSKQRRG